MSHDLPGRVMHAVEHVCTHGCRRVNEVIRDLEAGRLPIELRGLGSIERRQVLEELKQIMAVYEHGTCYSRPQPALPEFEMLQLQRLRR